MDPGQVAIDAGLATRAADNSVVFAPPPGVGWVARQVAEPDSAPPAALPAAAPAAEPPVAVAVPPAASVAPAAPDLATMADELYDRIELRLRADLLLERERRGSLPDF